MNLLVRKESLILLVFIVIITAPVFSMFFKIDRFAPLKENRNLAPLPALSFTIDSLRKFPIAYTCYFNDNFGLRTAMVRANFLIRYNLFGVSPKQQVIVGNNKWLFYAGFHAGDGEIEDYRGITTYDEHRLKRWATTLEMKRAWLEGQGIHYLFVVAPNKSSIYGEFLPDAYTRVRSKSALDDLIKYVQQHTKVDICDLRAGLLAAKTTERLFHKTDTHWNDYGAFIAYRQVMHPIVEWFPTLRIRNIDEYIVEKITGDGGDLARGAGGAEFMREELVTFRPVDGHTMALKGLGDKAAGPVSVTLDNNALPRVLVFHDSFFLYVAPFLAQHFQYSRFYWQYWNSSTPMEEILRVTRPNIVIEEIAERLINAQMVDFTVTPPPYLANYRHAPVP